jgi:hypothetical protein
VIETGEKTENRRPTKAAEWVERFKALRQERNALNERMDDVPQFVLLRGSARNVHKVATLTAEG